MYFNIKFKPKHIRVRLSVIYETTFQDGGYSVPFAGSTNDLPIHSDGAQTIPCAAYAPKNAPHQEKVELAQMKPSLQEAMSAMHFTSSFSLLKSQSLKTCCDLHHFKSFENTTYFMFTPARAAMRRMQFS